MLDPHPSSHVRSGALWAVSEAASLHAFVLVHYIHRACSLSVSCLSCVGGAGAVSSGPLLHVKHWNRAGHVAAI